MKKSERGRSVLELLCVLVVMILLVWGGARLWTGIKFDMQTQTLKERLMTMKNRRILSMNAHSNKRLSWIEKGPYDSVFSIENGIGPQNKDWFWITVKTSNSSLCSFLTEYDIDAGFVNDDCKANNEVTFYFLKFPENKSEDIPNKDNQPKECPENMICNDDFEPIGCKENYFLYSGNCIQCPENNSICENGTFECLDGYYKNGSICTACGTGVVTCDENGNPTECKDDYYLSGNSCVQCPTTGVDSCDTNGFTCLVGYYKNGNTCTSCGTGVVTCDEEGNPTECKDDYYLSDNTCVECPSQINCRVPLDTTDANGCIIKAQACSSGVCKTDGTCATTCNSGEYNSNGYCCTIGQKYQNGTCTSCASGEQCGCSNGTWDGEKCFECPKFRVANSTPTPGGDAVPNYPGCYCPKSYPYWVDVGEGTDPGCYASEWCYTNSDCHDGYFCLPKLPNPDTEQCDGGYLNGEAFKLDGVCLKVGLRSINSKYYTWDKSFSTRHSTGYDYNSSYGRMAPISPVASENFCKINEMKSVSILEGCTTSEKNTVDTKGNGTCSGWSNILSGMESLFASYAPVAGFYFEETLSSPCRFYLYSPDDDKVYFRSNGTDSSTPDMAPLCKKQITCPENSSETIRDGYQIGTTGCYCNEGYASNEDETGCEIDTSVCNGDMCCKELIRNGFTLDSYCNKTNNKSLCWNDESKAQQDTFFMYKTSSGYTYPVYKGDLIINEDLSLASCNLLVRGTFTANSNVEMKALTVTDGLTLSAGKKITAEDVGCNSGNILIERDAVIEADFTPVADSRLINYGTINISGYIPYYVENYGTITGDGYMYFAKGDLINTGTLLAYNIIFKNVTNSGTIKLSELDRYNEPDNCSSKIGVLMNTGTIEASGCIDIDQFKQTSGEVILWGLHISEKVSESLLMTGGKLVVDNLTVWGEEPVLKLSGNSELIVNNDFEYDSSNDQTLLISDNAMMQISPSDSAFSLGTLKMTGGTLKVPLLQIWGNLEQSAGEILVCDNGVGDSVHLYGKHSVTNGTMKATTSICVYSEYDESFCYSSNSAWSHYNPHIIPNADIPWCQKK